jgi:hypothetical protein
MADITHFPREMTEYAAIPMKGYINGRSLAAMTAERIAIPTNATHVVFSAEYSFVALSGDSTVTAAWPTDVDDGTASELNPTVRKLNGSDTHISVMMATAGTITARFYKQPS